MTTPKCFLPYYAPRPLHPNAYGTWTTALVLTQPAPAADILRALDTQAQLSGDVYRPLSGYIGKATDGTDNRSLVVLARDQSEQYGLPSPEMCDEIADDLAATLHWRRQPLALRPGFFRSIMGRKPGYGDVEPYSMQQVHDRIPTASGLGIVDGDLFSVRYGREMYTEPTAVVSGPVGTLAIANQLAYELTQERYVAEITDVATISLEIQREH
jgi:hypothetical protein